MAIAYFISNDPSFNGVRHSLGFGMNLQLPVSIFDMDVDGFDANEAAIRHHFIAHSFDKIQENFFFAGREIKRFFSLASKWMAIAHLISSNNFSLQRFRNSFGLRMHLELFIHVLDMSMHCINADK